MEISKPKCGTMGDLSVITVVCFGWFDAYRIHEAKEKGLDKEEFEV